MSEFVNPIDEFNRISPDYVVSTLLKDKRVKKVKEGCYGIHTNKNDKNIDFIVNEDGFVKVQNNCTIVLKKKELRLKAGMLLSPFSMFVIYEHKRNTLQAFFFLNNKLNKEKPPYIRVGVDYFKIVDYKDRDGIVRKDLVKWNIQTLKQDFDPSFLDLIPAYDGFGLFPDNVNYKQVVDNRYNQYQPFSHTPAKKVTKDQIKWSLKLIEHIFQEQAELGLLYMKLLYQYPKQILPILALVSAERETGKSTFGDWVNMIFGNNATVINPANISSSFNSSYGLKNIIIIEETKFDKSSDLEKIKSIATQKKITINAKFMPEYSVPFYGKIIMMSNHEEKFVKIDEEENRYWVRKVPSLKGKANHNILSDLAKEIPYFLKYLEQLPEPDFTKSRMVFTQEQIKTNILERTKLNSRSSLHKDIEIYLEKEMLDNPKNEMIYFRPEGLHSKYFRNSRYNVSYVKEVLKDQMGLSMDFRTRQPMVGEDQRYTQTRCFGVPNIHFQESALNNEPSDDEVPF